MFLTAIGTRVTSGSGKKNFSITEIEMSSCLSCTDMCNNAHVASIYRQNANEAYFHDADDVWHGL